MNRQMMLSILSTMDDSHLMHAMQAVGIPMDYDGSMYDPLEDEINGLKGWGERNVSIPPPRKPSLADVRKFVDQGLNEAAQVQQPERPYMMRDEGLEDLQPYAMRTANIPVLE